MTEGNGWKEHQLMVLHELSRLNDWCKAMDDKMDNLSEQVSILKFKAGVWGAAAGAIPVVVGIGVWAIGKM